jgi:hypothetical protein
MLQFHAQAFVIVMQQMHVTQTTLQLLDDENEAEHIERVKQSMLLGLGIMIPLLEKMNLSMTLKPAVMALNHVKEGKIDRDYLSSRIGDLIGRFPDELESRYCLTLEDGERLLYEQEKPLFGVLVQVQFPETIEDIQEAGKCLALGRHTAAVFHFMRVMEVGIQRLAQRLDIPLTTQTAMRMRTWGDLETAIREKVFGMNQEGARKAKFAAVLACFHSVRIAWRNETMHPKQTYSAEQGRDVLHAVRSYITALVEVMQLPSE